MPGAVAGRLRKEIIELGYGSVEYWTYRRLVDEAGADPLTTFGGISSFFYILLKPPLAFPWVKGSLWGPPPVGSGILWGQQAPPKLWGLDQAFVWHIDELRRVIRKWKPASKSCRFIEVWLAVDLFGNPLEVRRFPVHEQWEFRPDGAAPDFYNNSYSQERV